MAFWKCQLVHHHVTLACFSPGDYVAMPLSWRISLWSVERLISLMSLSADASCNMLVAGWATQWLGVRTPRLGPLSLHRQINKRTKKYKIVNGKIYTKTLPAWLWVEYRVNVYLFFLIFLFYFISNVFSTFLTSRLLLYDCITSFCHREAALEW